MVQYLIRDLSECKGGATLVPGGHHEQERLQLAACGAICRELVFGWIIHAAAQALTIRQIRFFMGHCVHGQFD